MDFHRHLQNALTKALGRPVVIKGSVDSDLVNRLSEQQQRELAARMIESVKNADAKEGEVSSLFGVGFAVKPDGTVELVGDLTGDTSDEEGEAQDLAAMLHGMSCPHEAQLRSMQTAAAHMASTLLALHVMCRMPGITDEHRLMMIQEALKNMKEDTLRKLLDKIVGR